MTPQPLSGLTLLVGGLALWRVTHLLSAEAGPFQICTRLRRSAGRLGWGRLLGCFYCLSVWLAAPMAAVLVAPWRERLLLWPALSATAILLERITQDRGESPPAYYLEDEGEEHAHVLLRKSEHQASRDDQSRSA